MRENKKNLFLRKMLLNLRFSTAISSSITYVYWFAQVRSVRLPRRLLCLD